MKSTNTSSVKSGKAEKNAATSNQNKNAIKVPYSQDTNKEKQVINARKATNLQLAKKKAKKRAKMAKASKKKNK
jgi:hypothetical protein